MRYLVFIVACVLPFLKGCRFSQHFEIPEGTFFFIENSGLRLNGLLLLLAQLSISEKIPVDFILPLIY
ncbi:hypothetical protein CHUAL_007526 [Chamberlinius hualienensis]